VHRIPGLRRDVRYLRRLDDREPIERFQVPWMIVGYMHESNPDKEERHTYRPRRSVNRSDELVSENVHRGFSLRCSRSGGSAVFRTHQGQIVTARTDDQRGHISAKMHRRYLDEGINEHGELTRRQKPTAAEVAVVDPAFPYLAAAPRPSRRTIGIADHCLARFLFRALFGFITYGRRIWISGS
jgi:hypothetical protein